MSEGHDEKVCECDRHMRWYKQKTTKIAEAFHSLITTTFSPDPPTIRPEHSTSLVETWHSVRRRDID